MKAFAVSLLLLLTACNQIKVVEPEPAEAVAAPTEIQYSWSLIESKGLLVPALCRLSVGTILTNAHSFRQAFTRDGWHGRPVFVGHSTVSGDADL